MGNFSNIRQRLEVSKGKFYAIDIGNTLIKVALVSNGKIKELKVTESRPKNFVLREHESAVAVVASVKNVKFSSKGIALITPEKDLRVPIKTRYTRTKLGIDRMLNAFYVCSRYKKKVIAVNMGSAVTTDIINSLGEHTGGTISSGIPLMLESLHKNCDKLPLEQMSKSVGFEQKNTGKSIRAGAYMLYISLLEKLRKEYKGYKIVGSGGYSKYFRDYFDYHVDHLTLRGLIELFYHYIHAS